MVKALKLSMQIIDKGAEVADGVVIRGTAENPVVIKKGEKITEDILS